MRRNVLGLALLLFSTGLAHGKGILIPIEKDLPPLAMLNHHVNIALEDQVAITKVDQAFRNHTDRQLEATYIFPVPKGASVRDFAMWVNGKKVKGELVEAAKAKQIYTDIVRQTQDPGLLEYMGADLLRLQVFPVPPKGDQKIELSYTSIARKDHEIYEYVYPLKTDSKGTSTLEAFTLTMKLKSQQPILNIYSPTHAVSVHRTTDREAVVSFEKNQAVLDKDFQLFYTLSGQDVGLTSLLHRPITAEAGYFLFLISPRAELAKEQHVPRDMVFVLDTSGSMREEGKINQAKKALRHCLDGLSDKDRFALVSFATTVNRYRTGLTAVTKEQITEAKKWVDQLDATGGTAINDAMLSALELQSSEQGRTFTVVFFTDGKPTIGETNPDRIMTNVAKRNTANTRIFTFGVGHDVNATMLDQIADQSRAISTYVRPDEDLEVKASSFFGKISHPVLANLRLSAGSNVQLSEVYPPQLPDLFHGGQLVVCGRYQGAGPTALTLTGAVGTETKQLVYELDFRPRADDRPFVEELWARRKVGYLLEQIRLNGEKRELVEEVTALAKKYGIATPYTSYLIVPDGPIATVPGRAGGPAVPAALAPARPNAAPRPVADFAKDAQKSDLPRNRGYYQDRDLARSPADASAKMKLREAAENKKSLDEAYSALRRRDVRAVQGDKLGVDLSIQMNQLKNQAQLQQNAVRRVANRQCLEIGGVWIDDGFDAKMQIVTVKAMSDAYFRILERHPQVKDVFQLGNHLVWVTPNKTALVIDTNDGKEKMSDEEIDRLFATR